MQAEHSILDYPSIPSWGVLILSIATLGLYPIWWFYSRAKIINGVQADSISNWQIHILAAVALLNVALDLIPGLALPEILINCIFWGHLGVYFWVVFCFKSEIESSLYLNKVREFQLSMFLSFILSPIYFQYKINDAASEVGSYANEST